MSSADGDAKEPRLVTENEHLLSLLSVESLCSVSQVSKALHVATSSNGIWSELYDNEDWKYFSPDEEVDESDAHAWKAVYGRRVLKERETDGSRIEPLGPDEDDHSLDDDVIELQEEENLEEAIFGSPVAVSINDMLKNPDLTLEQLLDVDEFLTALANHSTELVEFLKRGKNTEKLIEYVVAPSTDPLNVAAEADVSPEVQEQRRHSYVSYHALTSEPLTEILIEDYALLDALLTFLDHPSQNDALKNGYFSKILLTVYEKYPAELFLYFSIKSNVVAKFVQNINNLFLMELLFKFIDSLSSHQWLADERLIAQLVDLLDEEVSDVDTQESAVRTLEIVCNICSYCPYSVLVTQILEDEAVTQKLLRYTLSESPTKEFRIKQGLGIVIQVLNLLHKDPDDFGFDDYDEFGENEDQVEKPAAGEGAEPAAEPPYFVLEFTKRLPEFIEALGKPSSAPKHSNAGCEIESPFGFTRLRVLEFVVGLIGTGFPIVSEELERLQVFSICLGIFFDYRWNNFIHHQVYLLVSRVFSSSKNLGNIEGILRKSRFVERVLEAFEKFDPTTAGYFGHIVELCNELLNVSTVSAKVASYLEQFDAWPTFVREKLDPINEVCNTGPNAFGDDEDSMEDYDPEQYYFGIGQFNEDDYEEGEGEIEEGELGEDVIEMTPEEDAELEAEIDQELENL